MPKYTITSLRKHKLDALKKIASDMGLYVSGRTTIQWCIDNILELQNEQGNSTPTSGFDFGTNINTEKPQAKTKQPVSISISAFFIQINKSNLLDYFGSALIYPVNYEIRDLARSQRAKDIQHFAPDYLLISDGFTDVPSEEQILLEVSLSETDKQNLTKLNECLYLLPYPLPISRVNKIYFSSKESQYNSIATANTFEDAFLPKHIFDIWGANIESRISFLHDIKPNQIPFNNHIKTDKQDHFNRVLGMFAFMKNAELYYTNEAPYEFAMYSDKYFKILSLINPFFATQEVGELDKANLPFYSSLLKLEKVSVNKPLREIVNAIYEDKIFKKDIFKQILEMPTEDVQKAFSLLVADETLKALQAIDNLNAPELVLLVFLYRFRDKDGSDKFALKEQIPNLINPILLKKTRALNRVSIVLSTLGLYYGYRRLPKEEEIKLKDNFFKSFSENGKFNIKYKLDNSLDRITIESVFQFCFFGKKQKDSFKYLKDDNKKVNFNLLVGYTDDKTFSIIENYPVIRISRAHTEKQKEIKAETKGIIEKVILFLDFLKKNGLAQSELKFDENDLDIFLHKNNLQDLEKAISHLKS